MEHGSDAPEAGSADATASPAAVGDAAVVLDDLRRSFGQVVAVDGLSFAIGRGETFGLLGHNGAGKTTTVRLLNGVLAPTTGSSRVLGFDPVRDGAVLRERTGVLTESPSLDERLSARENLRFFAALHGIERSVARARVDALLERFGLSERATVRVSTYSRGMRQRLALARALVHDPELLFLDEPTAALDPLAARAVHELIREYHGSGRTVVICTHDLDEAQRLCDRLAILRRGRLLAIGTPRELGRTVSRRLEVEIDVRAEDRARALELLAGWEAGAVPGRDGTEIRLGAVDREAIPTLLAELVRSGVAVYRVVPSEPTLEDAYFALHEDEVARR